MAYTIFAGNENPKRPYRNENDEMVYEQMDGPRLSKFVVPDGYSLLEAFTCFVSPNGFWAHWSDDAPSWIEANNDALNAMLKENYGCEIGIPQDIEQTHYTYFGPPGVGPDIETTLGDDSNQNE